MLLTEYKRLADEVGVPTYRGCLLSVHGMNARALWQNHLGEVAQDALLKHLSVDYGMVRLRALWPPLHSKIQERILERYQEAAQLRLPIHVVAHSLGSLGLGKLLKSRGGSVRFQRVIVFGSILPSNFPWSEIVSRGQVESVLNECSSEGDFWVRLCRLPIGIPGSGASGCYGFRDEASGAVHNIDFRWSAHSDAQNHEHYRQTWLPFLLHGRLPEGIRRITCA